MVRAVWTHEAVSDEWNALDAGSTRNAALLLKIGIELGIIRKGSFSCPVVIKNLRTGRHQKDAGAWSWDLTDKVGKLLLGSCETVREIVKSYKNDAYSIAIEATDSLEIGINN
jgi:hypothetical protein